MARISGQLIWSLKLASKSKAVPNSSFPQIKFQFILELVVKRFSNCYFTAQMLSAQECTVEKSGRNSIDLTSSSLSCDHFPASKICNVPATFVCINILIWFSKSNISKTELTANVPSWNSWTSLLIQNVAIFLKQEKQDLTTNFLLCDHLAAAIFLQMYYNIFVKIIQYHYNVSFINQHEIWYNNMQHNSVLILLQYCDFLANKIPRYSNDNVEKFQFCETFLKTNLNSARDATL